MQTRCPQCGNRTEYSEFNKWRPFCSRRCRLIDLGEWIDEKKKITDNGDIVCTDKSPDTH